MAVLTLAQTLQVARIVASTSNIPTHITATAQPLYDGSLDMINSYANAAPDAAKNLALERLFGYLWEVERTGSRASADPLIQSGAASILNRYRTRRAGPIQPMPAAAQAAADAGLTEQEVIALIQEHAPAGGGGLTAAQVGQRIADDVSEWALEENSGEQVPIGKLDFIENWAHEGDATLIPAAKLGNAPQGGGGLSQSQVDARIADWAEASNTDAIPASKLTNAPQGGGGLTQANIDSRINTLIPPAQRIPSYAAGDAGEVLTVNQQGNGLGFRPETASTGRLKYPTLFGYISYTTISTPTRPSRRIVDEKFTGPTVQVNFVNGSPQVPQRIYLKLPYEWYDFTLSGVCFHDGTFTPSPPTSGDGTGPIDETPGDDDVPVYVYSIDTEVSVTLFTLTINLTNPVLPFLNSRGVNELVPPTNHIRFVHTLPSVDSSFVGRLTGADYQHGDRLLHGIGTPHPTGYRMVELVHPNLDLNVYRGLIYDPAHSYSDQPLSDSSIREVSSGFQGDSLFEFQSASPQNRRLYIPKTAPGWKDSQPTTFWSVFSTPPVPGVYPSGIDSLLEWGRASADDRTNAYAYHKPSGGVGLDSIPAGTTFSLTFWNSETARAPATNGLQIHSNFRWEPVDRHWPQVLSPALQGNADRWTKDKLPTDVAYQADIPTRSPGTELDEINPGFQLTSTTTNRFATAPSYFNPVIDLDDHASGEFHASLELTIAPTSDANMGFVQGKANQTADDRNTALSNIVFASDVVEAAVFVQQTQLPLNGVSLFRQTVYSGSTIVGHYNLILVRNSDNNVGAYWYWDGQAGGTGATITAELRVTFTPSDSAGGTGSVGALPTGGTTGQILRKTAAANYNASWQDAFQLFTTSNFDLPTVSTQFVNTNCVVSDANLLFMILTVYINATVYITPVITTVPAAAIAVGAIVTTSTIAANVTRINLRLASGTEDHVLCFLAVNNQTTPLLKRTLLIGIAKGSYRISGKIYAI